MRPSLTDTLCTRCALCCDGSLFADVELASLKEASGLELLGLDVSHDDGEARAGLLSLPCRALEGRRCGIYAHRPACCRSFECQLLKDAQSGAVSVEQALGHIADARSRIRRVKSLLAELGQRDARLPLAERCAEALTRDGAATPAVRRRRVLLEHAMSGVTTLLRRRFLGRGRAEG